MDRKSILGFILIFLIIMAMPYYYKTITHSKSDLPVTTDKVATTSQSAPIKSSDSKATNTVLTASVPGETREKELVIETDLYRLRLTTASGGSVKNVLLKNYRSAFSKDSALVELTAQVPAFPLQLRYISLGGDTVILNQNFRLITPKSQNGYFAVAGTDSLSLTFILTDAEQTLVRRVMTFYGNRYVIHLLDDLTNLRRDMAVDKYELSWEGGLNQTELLSKDEIFFSKAYALSGGESEIFDLKPGKSDQIRFVGETRWTAFRTKYFAVALIPEKPAPGYRLSGSSTRIQRDQQSKIFNMYLDLPVAPPAAVTVFFGPLDYTTVKGLNVNLENIMSFGWKFIRPISKAILWCFINLHRLIPNYGWVLIIFSVLIKVLLTPLTNSSMRSMKEMQKLQPQISALRDKYAQDPQKINAETMRLYKEYGINPMGGCIPLLLQFPIMIALFNVFRSTIELRQAGFIFWIKDLSAPDTIITLPFSIPVYGQNVNVLPILMVLSQILQQKMSGTSGNQQQKVMMYVMTIVFFFLFNQFPSGLNLYYTLFNVLSIVQQKYFPPKPKPKKQRKSTIQALRELQQRTRRR